MQKRQTRVHDHVPGQVAGERKSSWGSVNVRKKLFPFLCFVYFFPFFPGKVDRRSTKKKLLGSLFFKYFYFSLSSKSQKDNTIKFVLKGRYKDFLYHLLTDAVVLYFSTITSIMISFSSVRDSF